MRKRVRYSLVLGIPLTIAGLGALYWSGVQVQRAATYQYCTQPVNSLALSDNGDLLGGAHGSETDMDVRVGSFRFYRDAKSAVAVWDVQDHKLRFHCRDIRSSWPEVAFSPGDKTLLVAEDGNVSVWNVERGDLDARTSHRVRSTMAVSHDGKTFALADYHDIALWNVTGKAVIRNIPVTGPRDGIIRRLRFSPDDTLLAAALSDGDVAIRRTSTGAAETTLSVTGISDLAFSPDGKRFGAAGSDGQVKIWRTDSWDAVTTFPVFGRSGFLAFSADSELVIALESNTTVTAWKLHDRSRAWSCKTPPLPLRRVNDMTMSRNGRRLAIGTWEGHVHIIDLPTTPSAPAEAERKAAPPM